MSRRQLLLVAVAAGVSACAGGPGVGSSGLFTPYSLVSARPHSVGNGSMVVTPPHPWNRQSAGFLEDINAVEDWTLNGPLLDSMSFIAGLKDNKDIVRQSRRDDQQVPRFRANMTAPEIAAMLESFYRVRAGTIDFKQLSLAPRPFLSTNGFQLDFDHLDGDELWRRGRAVGAIVNGRLYLVLLDAARSHYFDADLPDFEATVASARLK